MLSPGGAVLFEVPCSENEYGNTDHLHFFSERSLRIMLDSFFDETEIVPNTYTTSAGVQCGSIYGLGRYPRCYEKKASVRQASLSSEAVPQCDKLATTLQP
jgi:hypothetical protein